MKNFNHPIYDILEEILKGIKDLSQERDKAFKNDSILTTKEVLELLKISDKTAKNWREKGTLPFYKVEQKIFYKREEIDEMISKKKVVKNSK